MIMFNDDLTGDGGGQPLSGERKRRPGCFMDKDFTVRMGGQIPYTPLLSRDPLTRTTVPLQVRSAPSINGQFRVAGGESRHGRDSGAGTIRLPASAWPWLPPAPPTVGEPQGSVLPAQRLLPLVE